MYTLFNILLPGMATQAHGWLENNLQAQQQLFFSWFFFGTNFHKFPLNIGEHMCACGFWNLKQNLDKNTKEKKSIASQIQHLNMKHFISRHMHQKNKLTGCTR